jgi:hypothetical protein
VLLEEQNEGILGRIEEVRGALLAGQEKVRQMKSIYGR